MNATEKGECPYCATNSGIHNFACLGCCRRILNTHRVIAGGTRLAQVRDVIVWMGYAHHIEQLEREREKRLSLLRGRAA